MKRRDETLPELAEGIERLTRLTYPEAAEAMVVVLAKNQFIDALPDEDMHLRIRQESPSFTSTSTGDGSGTGVVLTCK